MTNSKALGIYNDLWAYKFTSEDIAGGQASGPLTQWIQYLPRGTFNHPRYGALEMDDKLFGELKANFDNRVRKIDPAMDRDHSPTGDTEALAWFKEIEIRPDGLWALVEYTPLGYKLVHETKQFRYFSPEWGPFQDARTGELFENVIAGGAATNRPFLKELAPLAASEHWLIEEGDFAAQDTAATVQLKSKKKKKAKKSAPPDGDADDDSPNNGYIMSDKNTAPAVAPAPAVDDSKVVAKTAKKLTDVQAENKRLAEEVKALRESHDATQKQLKEEKVLRQLREWENVEVTVELKDESGEVAETRKATRTIAPRIAEMYRKVMLGEEGGEALTLKDFIDEGIKGGFVQLGEIGDAFNPQRTAPDDKGRVDSVKYLGETYEVKGMDTVRAAEEWARANQKDFSDPVVKMSAFQAVSRGERTSSNRSY